MHLTVQRLASASLASPGLQLPPAPQRGEALVLWTTIDALALPTANPPLEPLLAPDELDRAEAFQLPSARAEFVAGRALLRLALSVYHGGRPNDVPLVIDASGRPHLPEAASTLDFSLSHSGGAVGLALTRHGRVGFDLEPHDRHLADWRSIASWVFTEAERQPLALREETAGRREFLRRWVAKEAVLKALGTGFLSDPRECELSPEIHDQLSPGILRLPGGLNPSTWNLRLLPLGTSHLGAIALSKAC